MKKNTLVALLLMLCLLCAPASAQEARPVRVTATFFPLYIAAINLARDIPGLEIACLAPPSAGCLHDYQMTTEDRRALADSDVVILNGAGLETFLDKLLPTLSATVIDASAGVSLLEDEEGPNPHVWVSVKGMQAQVHAIAEGLAAAYPAYAAQLQANEADYVQRLGTLFDQMQEALAPYAGTPIVTFHEAFAYFAVDFDLRVVATVETHHDTAPSARDMAILADLVRAEDVPALFAEPQYETASVDILSRETGVPVFLLDPVVSGEANPTDYDAYLRIMRQNMDTLTEAFQ